MAAAKLIGVEWDGESWKPKNDAVFNLNGIVGMSRDKLLEKKAIMGLYAPPTVDFILTLNNTTDITLIGRAIVEPINALPMGENKVSARIGQDIIVRDEHVKYPGTRGLRVHQLEPDVDPKFKLKLRSR